MRRSDSDSDNIIAISAELPYTKMCGSSLRRVYLSNAGLYA